jgi:hypothetical protein
MRNVDIDVHVLIHHVCELVQKGTIMRGATKPVTLGATTTIAHAPSVMVLKVCREVGKVTVRWVLGFAGFVVLMLKSGI